MKEGDTITVDGKTLMLCKMKGIGSVCEKCYFYNKGNWCGYYPNASMCAEENGGNARFVEVKFKEKKEAEEAYDYFITADEAKNIKPLPLPDMYPVLKEIDRDIRASALRNGSRIHFSNDLLFIKSYKEELKNYLVSKGYDVEYSRSYDNSILIKWK